MRVLGNLQGKELEERRLVQCDATNKIHSGAEFKLRSAWTSFTSGAISIHQIEKVLTGKPSAGNLQKACQLLASNAFSFQIQEVILLPVQFIVSFPPSFSFWALVASSNVDLCLASDATSPPQCKEWMSCLRS